MTLFPRIAMLLAGSSLALAAPVMAQSQADDQRFQQAQQRFDGELRAFRAEFDRYQQARSRGFPRPGGYPGGPRYDDGLQGGPQGGRYDDPRYRDPRYDDRDEGSYDASRYYREGPGYQERVLSQDDRVYRGTDGRYYCKRNDGTTGLIVGAIGGGVLGNVIDGGHSRGVGTVLGAILGGVAGRSIDQNNAQVRCR